MERTEPIIPVVGRFAPSPTGPLHHGSLATALGSFLFARSRGGRWLLRIDDLDAPRVAPGAEADLLRTLEGLALRWDGPVVRQGARSDAYREAFGRLEAAGLVYPCGCSRAEIGRLASAPHPGTPFADPSGRAPLPSPEGAEVPYPGTCRVGLPPGKAARAWRLRVEDGEVEVVDGIRGPYRQDLSAACGDFVLLRADGIFAYHLAVVVDDAASGVTQVVRGADLLSSTPRQRLLYRLLSLPEPAWYHLPLVTGPGGEKLSKRDHSVSAAAGIDLSREGGALLWRALRFLGQEPPAELRGCAPEEVLSWGAANFRPSLVPRRDGPFPP
jgi:glutamyl-Q tRNA(Asp) synthetase